MRWSCFTATHGSVRLRVRERIAALTSVETWTDPSAWYWSSLLRHTGGPWLAVTVVETES